MINNYPLNQFRWPNESTAVVFSINTDIFTNILEINPGYITKVEVDNQSCFSQKITTIQLMQILELNKEIKI